MSLNRKYYPVISKNITESIPSMVEIAENQLGKSYLTNQDFTNEKNTVLRAAINNETVGFSIVTSLSNIEFEKEFERIYTSRLNYFSHAKNIGIIKSVAVANKFKRRCIADTILKSSISELKLLDVNVIVIIGWKSVYGTNIENLSLLNGFKKLFELPKYWFDDSEKNNYDCPVCGSPPCDCSAVIYTMQI